MREFVVRWHAEVDADTAIEAALSALGMLRGGENWGALVFQVTCPDGTEREVDLARDQIPSKPDVAGETE